MMVVHYIQTWRLCYVARHRLLLQCIASGLRKQFVSCHIDSTVIDVTQLGCPPLADISLPASAARLHVTSSYMFVHCGRPIYYLNG